MSSSPNLKRSRDTEEPDSQEIPEKRPTVESNLLKPSQFKDTTATKMNGLFKPSILPMTADYQKTMEKIAEKQKTEKKEPIVLKDPAKSYHPEGNKTNLPITTTTPSSGGASLGVFGKNIKEKVSETKETESTPEEPKKSETESDKKDETEKTETTDTETKTSPEKTSEKSTNPFAKAIKSSGFGSGGGGGFGAVGGGGFAGGFGKSENGFAKKETAGFKRLAGTTSSSWGNSSSSSQEEVKEKKSKQEPVKTGEEDEKNVLEVTTAKLFKFDRRTQQYSERGRGILRMNDKGEGSDFSSRLVFRTAGTQRVALNTQIWGGMSVEQCTKKSIRISAQDTSTDDDNEVGVFLIQCGKEQSKQLYQALSYRISQIKQKEEK